MGAIDSILSKFFGNKSQRDLKVLIPIADKIKSVYPGIKELSNDDLRRKSAALRVQIQSAVDSERKTIQELKDQVENENPDIDEREKIYSEIDKLEKEVITILGDALNQALPEAFSIIKDTARRFTENQTVEVTASDFDRELATTHDFVEIKGNTAIYKNSWTAGGNTIKWEMIHYDTQLIGGVVLHQGKIAEMATGEGKTLVATLPVFLNALTEIGRASCRERV